jgi:hypothetical protein
MKAILLLCLIAALNCNFIDTAFCLIRNDKLRSLVTEVIDTVKNKNFFKLIEIAMSNFQEVKSIVLNCVNDEPVLKMQDWRDVAACRIACGKDKDCLIECIRAATGKADKVEQFQEKAVYAFKK